LSRKPEQRLWDKLRKAAAGRVHTERLENLVGVGRPDVDTLVSGSFVPIELKQVARWPARAATPVLGKERGVRLSQRNWHLAWRRWGGQSLIVVGVADEVFTFNGCTADHVNSYNTAQFRAAAMCVGLDALVDMLAALAKKEPA
jgi:hypothetical protein